MSKRWSKIDEKKMVELYAKKNTYESIGKYLNRSPNAIKLRLELIVYDNVSKGKSIKLIAKMLNTTDETIKQLYYSHKSFADKKESKATQHINTQNKLEQENYVYEILIKNYELKQKINKIYNKEQLEKLIDKYF